MFESLKFFVRADIRIFVVERKDEANSYHRLLFIQMVKEGTSVSSEVEGPTNGVFNTPWVMFGWIDFPNFLETNSVGLTFTILSEVEPFIQLLGQVAMATF